MSNIDTIEALLEDNLKDIYSAEKQLIKALPKMAKAVSSDSLRNAIQNHLEETENQIQRLEKIAEIMEIKLGGKKCKAIEGLIEETEEVMKMEGVDQLVDAGIIVTAQKVEHYEIAAYGSLLTFAECLGQTEVANLLEQTLNEEKNADTELTTISEDDLLADLEETSAEDSLSAGR